MTLMAAGVAFLVTVLGVAVLLPILRIRLMDVPNARSSHSEVIPRGGGIAPMVGLVAGISITSPTWEFCFLIVVAITAALVGIADDIRDVPAKFRLVMQFALGVVVAVVLPMSIGTSPWAQWLLGAVAVVWLAGYVNAFNFMDGVNGISGISGALSGGWFMLLGFRIDDSVLTIGGAAVAGACLGFLPWNAPRARIFLGDVGSYGLGMFIGSLSLWAVATGISPAISAAPLLVYVGDTVWTLIRRLRRGDMWHEAHREHVYQRLCDVGGSHVQVTSVVGGFTLLICAAFWWLPTWTAVTVATPVMVAYLALPSMVARLTAWRYRAGQPPRA